MGKGEKWSVDHYDSCPCAPQGNERGTTTGSEEDRARVARQVFAHCLTLTQQDMEITIEVARLEQQFPHVVRALRAGKTKLPNRGIFSPEDDVVTGMQEDL